MSALICHHVWSAHQCQEKPTATAAQNPEHQGHWASAPSSPGSRSRIGWVIVSNVISRVILAVIARASAIVSQSSTTTA